MILKWKESHTYAKNTTKTKTKKQPCKTPESTIKVGLSFFKNRTPERNPEEILSTTIAYRHMIFQRQHAKVPSGDHTMHHCTVMPEPHEYPALPGAAFCVESTDEVLSSARHLLWMQQRSSLALQNVPNKSDTCAHGHTCHTNRMPSWHNCDMFSGCVP